MSEVVVEPGGVLFRVLRAPVVYKENERIVIEVPLKQEVRVVSVRLPEDVVYAIDKAVAITVARGSEEVSRSELIRRVVEALAYAFSQLEYVVDEVKVSCRNREKEVSVVLKLTTRRLSH
ncbi:MAG: hypothetical protein QXG57_09105 [Thermofilaceae archaeon]